jgi:hypothetical protein
VLQNLPFVQYATDTHYLVGIDSIARSVLISLLFSYITFPITLKRLADGLSAVGVYWDCYVVRPKADNTISNNSIALLVHPIAPRRRDSATCSGSLELA